MRSTRTIASALLLATVAACVCTPPPALAPSAEDALPVELFDYDRNSPLDVRTSPLATEEGVEVFEISYASPAGGRVTGRLYVPQGPPPFAGVVYAHGTGAGARTQGPRAVYLARHGAVVLTPDAPYVRRGGEIPTFTPLDSAEQVQHVQDLRRAFDVLAARADVDGARLAFVGRSHGGAMGALLAGVERRVKTYILIVADGGLVSHFRNPDEPSGAFTALADDVRRRWLAAMSPIEPIRFIHRAPPASILFQNGRQDDAVMPSDAAALHAAARGTTEVQWYDAGHRLNTESFVDQLTWLHQHAGMRAPGPDAAAGPNFPPPAPARP
jgi:cephalosporin-C deacetylase-like acetyl esterase